jgi:hypothetical protein
LSVQRSGNADAEKETFVKVASELPVKESYLAQDMVVAVLPLSRDTLPKEYVSVTIEHYAFDLGAAYVYSNSPHEEAKGTFGVSLFQR